MSNQHDENWPLSGPARAIASSSSPTVAPAAPRPYKGIVHDEEYVNNFVFPPVAAPASASLRLPRRHGDDDDDNNNEPAELEPSLGGGLPFLLAPAGVSEGTLPAPPTTSSTGRWPTPVSHQVSIRRGPQIRHLPVAVPSPPARAAALAEAKSKVKAVFLALVLLTLAGGLSLAAAMTFVASQAAMQGQVSGGGVGWLVTSLMVSAAGAGILYLTRHQKPVLLDDEWIELAALRGRDLALPSSPPPPPAAAAGATSTSLDMPESVAAGPSSAPALEPDIRIYIEDLEFQLKQLEDRLAATDGREPTGPPGPRPAALAEIPPPIPSKKGKEPAVTPFNSLTSRGSSRRLLAADTVGQIVVPSSATEGSILTQLCAAVTHPYSPLAHDDVGESSKQSATGQQGAGGHGKVSSIDIACGYMKDY